MEEGSRYENFLLYRAWFVLQGLAASDENLHGQQWGFMNIAHCVRIYSTYYILIHSAQSYPTSTCTMHLQAGNNESAALSWRETFMPNALK